MAIAAPDRLHFTDSDEANALLAEEPMALLIGFALDQQVSVQTAFAGPLKIKQRLGTLDAGAIAKLDPAKLEAAFRERPAVHRFPGSMATKVAALCAHVEGEYGGDASRLWREAGDSDELRRRIQALPGFGEMKVKALGSVLAKRFGVEVADGLVPSHPTLGDVDSREALESYQEAKRAYKAKLRARTT
ncbi:MAG: HhH-GPD-type base excision DNA repair protein [Gaiellaceae bacterium]